MKKNNVVWLLLLVGTGVALGADVVRYWQWGVASGAGIVSVTVEAIALGAFALMGYYRAVHWFIEKVGREHDFAAQRARSAYLKGLAEAAPPGDEAFSAAQRRNGPTPDEILVNPEPYWDVRKHTRPDG